MNPSIPIRYSAAVVQQTGQRHLRQQKQCEDVSYFRFTPELSFYGLADGQSGQAFCTVGAQTCLSAVCDYLERKGIGVMLKYPYADEIRFELIQIVRRCLEELSADYQTERETFASTLLTLAFDPKSGDYILIHLGDGCALGVGQNGVVRMLSAPDNGITSQYTWLTTSEQALCHLRICFGSVRGYRRLCLMTDGVSCICRGKNISGAGRALLQETRQERLLTHIRRSEPLDDASCILIDF